MSRYARRVDANHAEIASALRKLGAFVVDTSTMGEGIPDMWVTSSYWTGWLEVKDGAKPPSERKLRKNQVEFLEMANRTGKHAHVVLTVEEAIRVVFGEKVRA